METLIEESARLRQEVAELKAANLRSELRVQKLERRVQVWLPQPPSDFLCDRPNTAS
jgi:hypothetical protein